MENNNNGYYKIFGNGKNTITFVPLKEADKDKTVYFWVEIEK